MNDTLQNLIQNDVLTLKHRVRLPENGSMDESPCIILLHGIGMNEAELANLASLQDPRCTVILARGPVTFGPDRYGWFHVKFDETGRVINTLQAEQSRQLLLSFIEALPDAYGIDRQKIWIGGFSQGGIMSASVALTVPEAVKGFAILCGRILPEIAPLIAVPEKLNNLHAFVAHGVKDGKLSIDFAHRTRELLTQKTVLLTYQEYDAQHEITSTMERDFIQWVSDQVDA
ncbi:alpha/beta hydrolase [Glaciimonas sp. PCH181]|uniref:alpha/beta hydrolase n=1 Tax=Glaciimonas sp. PCH181 TaxID=2133943 RepID=UPI000D371DFC|nr:phospholipase [Glaciimonas sp. PCH181]PUA19552.1 phospholipase [Glaciimonas sp. PCH181]